MFTRGYIHHISSEIPLNPIESPLNPIKHMFIPLLARSCQLHLHARWMMFVSVSSQGNQQTLQVTRPGKHTKAMENHYLNR